MCDAGKTYWVPYKDIVIPIRLEKHSAMATYGGLTFRMFIGSKQVGHHWCIHCQPGGKSFGIYSTHEKCIASENKKITRAVNVMTPNGSKLRGGNLMRLFRDSFEVKLTVALLEQTGGYIPTEWLETTSRVLNQKDYSLILEALCSYRDGMYDKSQIENTIGKVREIQDG